MNFDHVISERFPGALTESDFLERLRTSLAPHGFDRSSTLATVGVCRDELCRSLVEGIERDWGEAFNAASLGGMLFLGRTGMLAAQAHAPTIDGRPRYLYYAGPHIAVAADGTLGSCTRPGRSGPSTACGALCALLGELNEGHVHPRLDPDDIEQSLLEARLVEALSWGELPDLAKLTEMTRDLIADTLERLIESTVTCDGADYAVVIGTQIHGPSQQLVHVANSYAMVRGERVALAI